MFSAPTSLAVSGLTYLTAYWPSWMYNAHIKHHTFKAVTDFDSSGLHCLIFNSLLFLFFLRNITPLSCLSQKPRSYLGLFLLHQSHLVRQQCPGSFAFKTYSEFFLSFLVTTPSKFSIPFLSWTIAVDFLLVFLFPLLLLALRAIFKTQIRSGHLPVCNPLVASHHA